MKLFEALNNQSMELSALVQYLVGKSEEMNTKPSIKTDTFLDMAHNMGINTSFENLATLAQQEPLKNMITDVNKETIEFGDAGSYDKMPVDKARDTVKKMAKSASNKRS